MSYTVIAVNENTFVIQALNTNWYSEPKIVKEEKNGFSFKWYFSGELGYHCKLVLTDVRLGLKDIQSCENTVETIKCYFTGVETIRYDMVETNSRWETNGFDYEKN